MRLGICQVPYVAHGWLPPQPTLDSWKALRLLGVTDVRLQFDLSMVSPTPNAWDASLFDTWARPAKAAGMRVAANVVIGPYDPKEIIKTPPAHHTADFRAYAARRLVTELGDLCDSYAVGNEPGFGPWMDDDVSRVDGGRDYIRERYFPDFVVPVVGGIRVARADAIITGFEADSPEIQLRCMAAAKENRLQIDAETVHPYGDVGGGDYATMVLFDREYRERRSDLPRAIGEIDHQQLPDATGVASDGQVDVLDTFSRKIGAAYPDVQAIYFGTPEYLFTREPAPGTGLPGVTWSTWTFGTPLASAAGLRLAATFAAINTRRRAVRRAAVV